MCIGLPMIVRHIRPGFATVEGRGEMREVNTALVGEVHAGQWLLVFLDGARECISPERAREVNDTLDLLAGALGGSAPDPVAGTGSTGPWAAFAADPGFALPSALSAADVAALTGTGGSAASNAPEAGPAHDTASTTVP
jgi:hydrogenase expression/formation protein HypC